MRTSFATNGTCCTHRPLAAHGWVVATRSASGPRTPWRVLAAVSGGVALAGLLSGCAAAEQSFAGPECIPRPTAGAGDTPGQPDTLRTLPPLQPGQTYCPSPNASRYPVR